MLKSHTPQPVLDKPDAGGATGTAAPTITVIAAELATRKARLEEFGGRLDLSPAEDEEWERLYGECTDLELRLTQRAPRNVREVVVTAVIAFERVHGMYDIGCAMHIEACHLLTRVLEWAEAEAGVTAEELGLSTYAASRGEAPVYSEDDGQRAKLMVYNAGYLAAVRRFAPTFYPFVKLDLQKHEEGLVTAATGSEVRP